MASRVRARASFIYISRNFERIRLRGRVVPSKKKKKRKKKPTKNPTRRHNGRSRNGSDGGGGVVADGAGGVRARELDRAALVEDRVSRFGARAPLLSLRFTLLKYSLERMS